jgi:hypothetical protein
VIGAIDVCFVQYQTLPVDLTPNQPSVLKAVEASDYQRAHKDFRHIETDFDLILIALH